MRQKTESPDIPGGFRPRSLTGCSSSANDTCAASLPSTRPTTRDDDPTAAASSAHPGPTTLPPTSPRSGSGAAPSSAASSMNTNRLRRRPGQDPWPSSGTPQAVGGVDQRRRLSGEPERDHPAVPGRPGRVRPASTGPGRRRRHKGPPGPGGGRKGHAASETAPTIARRSPAPPRSRRRAGCSTPARTPVIERWNSSARACTGTRHPIVDLAHGDRAEDRPHRVPVTPANRSHPKRARVDEADRGKHLDASGSCAPTPPMTSTTGKPAARRSRIQGASSAGRPQTTI